MGCRTPSTVGGRRANATRRRQKGRKKGSGIRQGTAGEERALAEHIRSLEPTAEVSTDGLT
jgi:ribosomal protein L19E